MKLLASLVGGIFTILALTTGCFADDTPLFSESFENLSWSSRGWYDNTAHGLLETSGCYSGNCLKWSWSQGATTPANGGGVRRLFTPVEEVFLRYYLKVGSTWQGSGLSYQPHMIQIMSDLDSAYQGPAYAYLDSYFEINGNPPSVVFGFQDSERINTTKGTPPINLTGVTENRSVAGCNGTLGDPGTSESCYQSGSWYNGRMWKDTATLSKDAWHKIEFYLKMNTISNNVAQANGILQLWVDGNLTISKSNILYRTNQDPTKRWTQLFFGPYMGSGSPVAQTAWIDELSIYNSKQVAGGAGPAAPTGLKVGP